MNKNTIIRDKFDFDVGMLMKSPCLKCSRAAEFPVCFNNCKILNDLRTILAQGISCTYSSDRE